MPGNYIKLLCNATNSSHTYHSLNIQDGGALINVSLSSDWTSWELIDEGSLELLNVIFKISVHGGDLHQLVWINLTQLFNVNWPAFLVNSMVSLWIVLLNFFNFLELKILFRKTKGYSKVVRKNIAWDILNGLDTSKTDPTWKLIDLEIREKLAQKCTSNPKIGIGGLPKSTC